MTLPLSLSDQQLAELRAAARRIPRQHRSDFLTAIGDQLYRCEEQCERDARFAIVLANAALRYTGSAP
jgi:hypothetical protein